MRKQSALAKVHDAHCSQLAACAMLLQLTLDTCPWHAQRFPPDASVQLLSGLHPRSVCKAVTWRVAQVLVHGEERASHTEGIAVGTAEVELSLLHIMGQVSGWYNILNARYGTASPNAWNSLTQCITQPHLMHGTASPNA